jgi:hypothetical protein
MTRMIMAEKDGIEGWEIGRFACRGHNTLRAHEAKTLFEDGIKQGAKVRRELRKYCGVPDPRRSESRMAGALRKEHRRASGNYDARCIGHGKLALKAIAASYSTSVDDHKLR